MLIIKVISLKINFNLHNVILKMYNDYMTKNKAFHFYYIL
jgi:hypothetical protein